MKKEDYRKELWAAIRARNYSYYTYKAYWEWVSQFADFCIRRKDLSHSDDRVREFLNSIANDSAYATQKQCLNALAFFFKNILGREFKVGEFAKAKKPTKLPVCLSRQEVGKLLSTLSGQTGLMARLCYGSGMRLAELISLRIKDLDFDNGMIFVRSGKGDKDRTVSLPASISFDLRQQVERAKLYHDADRRANLPAVYMPNRLGKKYPAAGKQFTWFWIWPGNRPSKDPETGIIRRHHVHRSSLQNSIYRALPKTGINKKVCVHTLRHSYATHMLQHEKTDIYTLQNLLGHKDIATTEIYLHCVPDIAGTSKSPLDSLGELIEFPSQQAPRQANISG